MQVEISLLIPGSYHRLANIPGNRWAEDKYPVPTASKRYHRLKQTGWLSTDLTLSSPACSVRLTSPFTVCCSFEFLLPRGLSRNVSLCSTSPHICEPLSQCDGTRHPSLCSPSQAAASNSSACQSLPPFATDSLRASITFGSTVFEWLSTKLAATGIISGLDFNKIIEPVAWFCIWGG